MQVWNGGFSKEFYLQQVHRPRHYKGGESAPLFGNFLEPLSKTPWWVVPAVWMPWIAYGTYEASKGLPNASVVGALFGVGIAIWTLVEYGLHRCLFHVDQYAPRLEALEEYGFDRESTGRCQIIAWRSLLTSSFMESTTTFRWTNSVS
jgi:hypothetical protein